MTREEFLNWLYEHCESAKIETRAIKYKGNVVGRDFHDLGNWGSVSRFCKKHHRVEVYFAVATRDDGGTKAHIVEIPAAFVDIDFKDIPQGQARELLWEFEARPSAIVESGGGYHAYWKFREPATKDDIEAVEELNKRLAAHFNIPEDATDASRILRLPETWNNKLDSPRAVKVVGHENFLYTIEGMLDLPSLAAPRTSATSREHPYKKDTTYNNSFSLYKGDIPEGDTGGQKGTQRDNIPDVDFSEGHHDNSLFSIAFHLGKGGMSPDNVLETVEFLANKLDPDNETKQWARAKTKSAFDRLQRRETSLAAEIRAWVGDTRGTFWGTEVDKDLHLGTKGDKQNRKKVLQRLVAEGLIERVKGQNNFFRRVEVECEEIDFRSACHTEVDVKWPFEIEKHFRMMPGNLAVVAGEPDACKTAFLLNVVRLNMHKHEIHYFSSEMGPLELRERLEKFEGVDLAEWRFHAKERSNDFADVIVPNAVNLVDFLEIHDVFYTIGGWLKDIHDRLDNGVAIIALQKPRGRDEGRGGEFTKEKPRLYVSLSNNYPGHIIKLVKVKNWRDGNVNPNGLQQGFRLTDGCKFWPDGKWYRE